MSKSGLIISLGRFNLSGNGGGVTLRSSGLFWSIVSLSLPSSTIFVELGPVDVSTWD